MASLDATERQQLGSSCRSFFREVWDLDTVRGARVGSNHVAHGWSRMAKELGLQAIAIPQDYGGAGYGLSALSVVLAEAGRALYGGPLLASSCMGVRAVLHAGSEEQKALLLPQAADGGFVPVLALAEPDRSASRLEVETRVVDETGGPRVYGVKSDVIGLEIADQLVVLARDETRGGNGDLRFFLVDVADSGTMIDLDITVDLTRAHGTVRLHGAKAICLGGARSTMEPLRRTLADARASLAAELMGTAEACLEMAVEYARVREQFGRKIGSFQAIKHACADVAVDVELARSAVEHALVSRDEAPDSSMTAALAIIAATTVAQVASRENIQIHGGIGFTWEHPAHLYFRRAVASGSLLGTVGEHWSHLSSEVFGGSAVTSEVS